MTDINQRIADLEQKREEVKGTVTEVYERIVGYYRPITHWNKGKAQERVERKMFEIKGTV
jgi:anaerobic ribonucleoside-triphosphate reductase